MREVRPASGSKCEELEPSISGPLLPPKADVPVGRVRVSRKRHPRCLFDHLVGEREQEWRNFAGTTERRAPRTAPPALTASPTWADSAVGIMRSRREHQLSKACQA
jgi:hypothetical protein